MSDRRAAYIAISLALSVLLMGLLISRIDAAELGRALARIFVPGLLAYMAIALLGAGLRAWRYRLFLRPRPVRWPDILMATFIRNSFVDLLPARLGSLSLIYVLNKRLGVPVRGRDLGVRGLLRLRFPDPRAVRRRGGARRRPRRDRDLEPGAPGGRRGLLRGLGPRPGEARLVLQAGHPGLRKRGAALQAGHEEMGRSP